VLANTELPAQRVLMISPPVYAVGPVWPVVVLEEVGALLLLVRTGFFSNIHAACFFST
jgi:hypothetical protein